MYKCRSFHLVTIEEPYPMGLQACQLSTMSEGEYRAVMMAHIKDILESPVFKEKLEKLTTKT